MEIDHIDEFTPYNTAEYTPSCFNELPLFSDSVQTITKERIQADGISTLREIFQRYKVHSTLGLIMLHRHFDIQNDEKVVEFRGLSTPWKVSNNTEIFGGRIVPRCWAFAQDGSLHPTEFRFEIPSEQVGSEEPIFPTGFIREFYQFLENRDLSQYLGLTAFDPVTGFSGAREVERTVGRVSITLPINETEGEFHQTTETAWSFGCHERMDDSAMMNARICWVCLGCS